MLCECLFYRPTKIIQSLGDYPRRQSKIFLPRCKTHRHTIVGYQPVSAPVSRLYFGCIPDTIFLGVSKIVVSPFQRQSKRRIAHVCVEVFKRAPSFTNPNAASTIIFIAFIIWIEAALKHVAPNDVNWSPKLSVGAVFLVRRWLAWDDR